MTMGMRVAGLGLLGWGFRVGGFVGVGGEGVCTITIIWPPISVYHP